jgi:dipeptidyl aminopeptidase/acylaminoacyl peptidase
MRRSGGFWAVLTLFLLAPGAAAEPARHPITIDDVLAMERVDSAVFAPDGEWAAVVVRRAASTGEVYGRTAFETDPGRSDIWLVSSKTGERRRVTDGKMAAAGYWCATWSPDGRRLAMLSTQPEGAEPRGGDNVRLYVWDRASGRLARQGHTAIMTQTRYGSPLTMPDLRGGADRGTLPHACSREENAPFLWLDDVRILAATLPPGRVSALIDQYGRAWSDAARDAARLRAGQQPTGVAFGSGAAPVAGDPAERTILRIVDVADSSARDVASVPAFPLLGAMSVAVSPDGRRLAVLATTAAFPPAAGKRRPFAYDDLWTVERRLGFVDLMGDEGLRWATLPAEARYPLELYDWSPDSRQTVLRARADPFADRTHLYVVPAAGGGIRRVGSGTVAVDSVRTSPRDESPVLWLDPRRLLARLRDDKGETSWRLIGPRDETRMAHGDGPPPAVLRRNGAGAIVAVQRGGLVRLDPARAAFVPVARLAEDAMIVWPRDPAIPSSKLLVNQRDGATGGLRIVDSTTGASTAPSRPIAGDLHDVALADNRLLMEERGRDGLVLRGVDLPAGLQLDLATLNPHLRSIDWGQTRLIDYKDAAGAPLKANVILPPGHDPAKRYPTLLWVYQSYQVSSLEGDYFLDPYMPGLYNLRLYAAHGYVVVVPSMPLPSSPARDDPYALVPKPIMPAIDRLVELGIADPDRLGVFGQSRGGYTVFSLLAQTNRFKAGVALAGISDLASSYRGFDPTGYGWPGIGHQKSSNWAISEQFGRSVPPSEDAAGYTRNSPLTYARQVTTPLLLIHGEADIRGDQAQAEQFFAALHEQGKTAQYVRYGGESHSLAQSPANVRDIVARTLAWFDRFVKAQE